MKARYVLPALSCLCLLAAQPTWSAEELSLSAQESFQLKRISEYWKDKNYSAVKKQILDYLATYPQSSANEHLYAMLGDLYFQENQFEEALCAYEQIENASLEEKTIFSQLQCLFELKDYPSVVDLARVYFEKKRPEKEEGAQVHFMVGESLFRLGLKSQEERKQLLFAKAKGHYKAILNTPYEEFALFPLTEIHKTLKEDKEAISCYLLLAQKHPDKQEECLFQAAVLQISTQPEEAVATFDRVVACNGKRAPLAAFNALSLLFQNKKYAAVVDTYTRVSSAISETHSSTAQYYVGKSYLMLGEHQRAIEPLATYIKTHSPSDPHHKAAILNLLLCAKELKNPKLFHEYSHLLFSQYENVLQKEAILYDYALLLSENKQWKQARLASLDFLREFPLSDKYNAVLRHLIFSSQQDLKASAEENRSEKRMFWIADLQQVLKEGDKLSDQEKVSCRNFLIQAYHDHDQHEAALKEIETALQSNPENIQLHLWAASCEQRLRSPDGFIRHAEKVLALNPDHPGQDILHLELYNAYLEKKQLDQAGEHLFAYVLRNRERATPHNLYWLANFLYQKAQDDQAYLEKAHHLFAQLIPQPLHLTPENLHLEKEVLKWAELLAMDGRWKERTDLLSQLSAEYEKNPTFKWKYQRRALFELAKSYEALPDRLNALKTYENLSSSSRVTSFIGCASLLQKARLKYALLEESKKNEHNPEMDQILNDLKDLQISKKLSLEPLHLEAALDYIDMKHALKADPSRHGEKWFLLKRFEEDFTNAYSPEMLQQTEQKELLDAYLGYARAQMLFLEAREARQSQKLDHAEQCEQKAALEVNHLLSQKESLTPYLVKHLETIGKDL